MISLDITIDKDYCEVFIPGERSTLVGLVKCGRCGSSIPIFSSPCANSNVRVDILRDLILSHITGLVNNKRSLQAIFESTNDDIEDRRVPLIAKRNKLQSELNNLEIELYNLVDALSKGILPEIVIKRKYKDLEAKKIELRNELEITSNDLNYNYVESYDFETVVRFIKNFKYTYGYMSLDENKKLFNSIVKEIQSFTDKMHYLNGLSSES